MQADTLLVGNGTLITFGKDCRLISGGALLLDGGRIAVMGDTATLRAAHPNAAFIDARGQYIMPGMICAHTHTYGAFARGMALKDASPENFVQILERLWWRLDRALTLDDVYYSALVCLIDAIKHGTTTLVDHHASPNAYDGSLDIIAQAFQEAGLRGCLCYEVSDREGKEKGQAGIRENERFIRRVRGAPPSPQPSPSEGEAAAASLSPWGEGEGRSPAMLSGMMGLHASFTLSDETLQEAVAIARDLGVGCHIHVAEDQADQAETLERYGHAWVVDRLERLGVLGPKTIAAHCVHVDDEELRILAETGTWVAHNPRSNMNNAVGTANVPEMLRRGIKVGLGNDGFSNDMFEEMKAAYLAHKAARGDPQVMPASDVLRLAVENNARLANELFGARAVGFGRLAAGAPADVILLDYHPPTPLTAANLPWHAMFGITGGMVTTTIVAGRVLMRDRQLLTLDEGAIAARAQELAQKLWERL